MYLHSHMDGALHLEGYLPVIIPALEGIHDGLEQYALLHIKYRKSLTFELLAYILKLEIKL